jgi:Ser/Thr protein kinase RdoA (MazF antagonist)
MNLGLGLGTVHQYSPHEILSATGNYDHNHLWPLRHHLRSDSDATPEFIGTALAIRSRPALCAQIEGLNEHLAAMPNTLVHGDARWQNVLVHYGDDGQLTTDEAVTLIDWEFAGEGPPGWDVGGIIQSFLAFHLLRPNADPASAVRHLLDTDQDCIVALLRGYCTLEHAWASPPQVVRWSVECAVGHLMQSVYDSGSRSHADSLYVGKLLETVAILAGAHDDIAATILRAIVEC